MPNYLIYKRPEFFITSPYKTLILKKKFLFFIYIFSGNIMFIFKYFYDISDDVLKNLVIILCGMLLYLYQNIC